MAAVRNVPLAFGFVELTKKPLELSTCDVAGKQVISTIRYCIRSIDFKSGITKAMTMQIVEVTFRDLTRREFY